MAAISCIESYLSFFLLHVVCCLIVFLILMSVLLQHLYCSGGSSLFYLSTTPSPFPSAHCHKSPPTFLPLASPLHYQHPAFSSATTPVVMGLRNHRRLPISSPQSCQNLLSSLISLESDLETGAPPGTTPGVAGWRNYRALVHYCRLESNLR